MLEPVDLPALRLADGRPVDHWIEAVVREGGASQAHLQRLALVPVASFAPVVCAARLVARDRREVDQVVVYDGWHRVAAWSQACAQGRPAPLAAWLVVTQWRDPQLTGRYK